MIGKLKGLVEEVADDHVIVDVHGVGYIVHVTSSALAALSQTGQAVTLFIEMQVREDAIRLFGFFSRIEQEWFRLLQGVHGVGAKVALAVLGTLGPDGLAAAIALHDISVLTRTQGVGKKMAERIMTELNNKAPMSATVFGPEFVPEPVEHLPSVVAEAVSALCNLGYARDLATRAVAAAVKAVGEDADSVSLIRFGLRELAR
ncbi:MAG: holliday junction DNA helicase RuvA [Candidatus Tokpelaia sp. JSC085]|nr:MAG: holliday junction DNA helicase RuvA [Candidatus Tokpelaia sp. JSC085]